MRLYTVNSPSYFDAFETFDRLFAPVGGYNDGPAYDVAKPMDNTDFELHWRKKIVRSLVGHALRELRGDDMRGARLRLAKQVL